MKASFFWIMLAVLAALFVWFRVINNALAAK